LTPNKREVWVEDELVRRPHKNVGIVFQEATLPAWRNVLNNILLQIEVRKVYQKKKIILTRSWIYQAGGARGI